MNRIGDWIQTFTGKKFYPLDPRPEDICIEDIAHALSQVCRFAGHTARFYSVAQHSMIVAGACPKEAALWGLLHDASEAYIGDMTRPLKRSLLQAGVTFYKDAEHKIMEAVCDRFCLSYQEPDIVSEMDARALLTERRDLLTCSIEWEDWTGRRDVEPFDVLIVPVSSYAAEWGFLDAFEKYQ